MMPRRMVIIGAGGHARETALLARMLGHEVAGFVVSDLAKIGDRDSRDQILGDFDWLHRKRSSFDALAIGIGTPQARLRVAAALEPSFDADWWPVLVLPSNFYDPATCVLGHGCYVAAGVIMTVNVTLKPFAMLNFGCTIGHETVIGRGTVINPGANISGGITIGDGVLIGTGAQVLQYLTVGDGATVGAGAVVTRSVDAGVTVLGVPAQPRPR